MNIGDIMGTCQSSEYTDHTVIASILEYLNKQNTDEQGVGSYDDDEDFRINIERLPIETLSRPVYRDLNTTFLHIACQNNKPVAVRILVEKTRSLNPILKDSGMTPFQIACERGFVDVVKVMLDHPRTDVNATYLRKFTGHEAYSGLYTPLHAACELGNLDIVRLLLNCKRTSVNQHINYTTTLQQTVNTETLGGYENYNHPLRCRKGPTAFLIACMLGHDAIVRAMLQNSRVIADITLKNQEGGHTHYTYALIEACRNGHDETIKALLSDKRFCITDKVLFSKKDACYKPSFHMACRKCSLDMIRLLLEQLKSTIRSSSRDLGYGGLREAIKSERVDVVTLLLDDTFIMRNERYFDGVFELSCERETSAVLQQLAERPQFRSVKYARTAANNGNLFFLKAMLESNIITREKNGSEIFQSFINMPEERWGQKKPRDQDLLKWILANFEINNDSFTLALRKWANDKNIDFFRLLLADSRVNPNITRSENRSASLFYDFCILPLERERPFVQAMIECPRVNIQAKEISATGDITEFVDPLKKACRALDVWLVIELLARETPGRVVDEAWAVEAMQSKLDDSYGKYFSDATVVCDYKIIRHLLRHEYGSINCNDQLILQGNNGYHERLHAMFKTREDHRIALASAVTKLAERKREVHSRLNPRMENTSSNIDPTETFTRSPHIFFSSLSDIRTETAHLQARINGLEAEKNFRKLQEENARLQTMLTEYQKNPTETRSTGTQEILHASQFFSSTPQTYDAFGFPVIGNEQKISDNPFDLF